MALTQQQIQDALGRGRGPAGRPRVYTDEEKAQRAKASSRASNDAKAALVRLHPEEYSALYQAALKSRREELNLTD